MMEWMERLTKTEIIRILRDVYGLSWNAIAEVVEGKRDSKSVLKVYGLYCKAKMRRNSNTEDFGIVEDRGIVFNIDYYVKSKVYESHVVEIVGDLQKERLELAKLLKHTEGEKREEVYKKLCELKLLELLIIIYDLIGLSQYDRDRMYLSYIISVGKKLLKHLEIDRDHVKWSRSEVLYLTPLAAAFVYTVFFLALNNTPYVRLLDEVRRIIYAALKGRKERKIEEVRRIIREKFLDVIGEVVLRI